MIKSVMSNKVEIRDNGINGKGIFAKEFIKKVKLLMLMEVIVNEK